MKYELHKPTDYGVNLCEGCLEMQREIDRLREKVHRLKARLNQRERQQKEGVFGSSTPSSLKPLKPNGKQDQSDKRGGAKMGIRVTGACSPQRCICMARHSTISSTTARRTSSKGRSSKP